MLGKIIAERLGWQAMDVDPYQFPSPDTYASSRTREAVQQLLLTDMERIRQRELQHFGDRVLKVGDLFESQQRFRAFAAGQAEEPVLAPLRNISCPALKLDATLSVEKLADENLQVFHNL